MIRPRIRRLFHLALRGGEATDRETAAEIDTHITLRIEQLIAQGYSPEQARVEALRRFGDREISGSRVAFAARRREQRLRFAEWLDGVRGDVAYALRSLRREPLVMTFIVLTFALGIGATAAMFGVIDRLLLSGPVHVSKPQEIKRLYAQVQPKGWRLVTTGSFGYVTYDVMRKSSTVFDGVAAYHIDPDGMTYGRGAEARTIDAGIATADLFALVGVQPRLGRFFTAEEDQTSGGAHVAVIGHALWKRDFGEAEDVIGRTIVLNDETFEVIGVAPRGFTGPELSNVDVWIPMSTASAGTAPDWPRTWQAQWLQIIGRVKPGVSSEAVDADITAAFARNYTGDEDAMRTAKLIALPLIYTESGTEPGEVRIARWLFAVAIFVLVIACSNVANLLLARALRRRREVAVRVALGAGRRRLVRLLITESLTLSLLGAVASCVFAYVSAQVIRGTLLPDIEWVAAPVSLTVLAVAGLTAIMVGVLVGLVPALQVSRPDMTSALKTGVREGGNGGAWRLRSALTIVQAAMCVLLLIGAGLFIRSLHRAQSVNLGIEPDRVLITGLRWPALSANATPEARLAERARRITVYREALERARTVPGVMHASLSVGLPFDLAFSQRVRIPGRDSIPRLKSGGPRISAVTDDYFETVGTPLVRGRAFSSTDRAGSEPVTIVSALMASTIWPGEDALGKCLQTGDGDVPCARIVGIAGDAHRSRLREDPGMHYYVPYGQERQMGGTKLLIRPAGDPMSVSAAVTRIVQELDPTVSFIAHETLQSKIDPQMRPWKLGASTLGMMGVLALLVASVGLYSVMSYLVTQRTHELGVRVALGASGGRIVGLVMRGGVGLAAVGIVIGIVAAMPLGRFVAPVLFDTSPRDVLVFTSVAAAMLVVALLATLLPALRARRVSPLTALRSD
jgi:predicted permease